MKASFPGCLNNLGLYPKTQSVGITYSNKFAIVCFTESSVIQVIKFGKQSKVKKIVSDQYPRQFTIWSISINIIEGNFSQRGRGYDIPVFRGTSRYQFGAILNDMLCGMWRFFKPVAIMAAQTLLMAGSKAIKKSATVKTYSSRRTGRGGCLHSRPGGFYARWDAR